jgi:hypothetical protein
MSSSEMNMEFIQFIGVPGAIITGIAAITVYYWFEHIPRV